MSLYLYTIADRHVCFFCSNEIRCDDHGSETNARNILTFFINLDATIYWKVRLAGARGSLYEEKIKIFSPE